ncbi:MAG: amino acid ABC transporter permease [Firmicutes bacterium]|nr:amino acid ABC transporter permease [Bacillota bacterium]
MDIEYILKILPYILDGLRVTSIVFVFTIAFSLIIGIVLGVVASSKYKVPKIIIETYTWIFRGTPLLLQLYFGMYGLPAFGIVLERMNVAILIFSLNYGAYFTEIFRGSILSIDKGQIEVSKTLGFHKIQTYFYIVIPQALKRSIQAVGNETITLIKDTALVAAIALNDLLRNAKEIVSRDFKVDAFFVVGIIYILLSFVIVKIFKKLEMKYEYFR